MANGQYYSSVPNPVSDQDFKKELLKVLIVINNNIHALNENLEEIKSENHKIANQLDAIRRK